VVKENIPTIRDGLACGDLNIFGWNIVRAYSDMYISCPDYISTKGMRILGNSISGERFFTSWLYDEKDEFIQAAYKGLKNVGLNPVITQYSFCTNGNHYAEEKGIKTIRFEPSKENLAHNFGQNYLRNNGLKKNI
jgi:hypothetical protein